MGRVYLSLIAHRGKDTIKILGPRRGARKSPYNTDMSRWVRKELISKTSGRIGRRGSTHIEFYASCVLGFFYLLRISDIEALTCGDLLVDTQNGQMSLSILIKQSKTYIFRHWVARSVVGIDAALFPAETFLR